MSLRRTEGPPPERTFWELLPRRNLRRVIFLVAVLFGVIILQRSSGRSFRSLFESLSPLAPTASPSPARASAKDAPKFYPMKVVPPGGAGGSPP